jgi:hypothetical protein
MAAAYHAEHVGSLLRSPRLLRAREAGTLTEADLREVEDEAILQLIALQQEAGLRVFTDGEAPQCGFASGSLGNLITVDDERRKLELVASTAARVWG